MLLYASANLITAILFLLLAVFIYSRGRHIFSNLLFSALSVAISMLSIERIWETFFLTSSSSDASASPDLNFTFVVLAYFAVVYGAVIEFFSLDRPAFIYLTPIGFCLLLTSAAIRLWAIRTLGRQWTTDVSARSPFQITPRELKREGPYRYVRHPVYFGAVLEVLAIVIMGLAFYMLIFVLVVNIPLYVMRLRIEERSLREIFGEEYNRYSMEVGSFFPILKKSSKSVRSVGG